MNDLASMQSTVVLDQPPTPAAREASLNTPPAPTPADSEFADLLENYRALIHARTIPYPVAYQFNKELGHGRQGVSSWRHAMARAPA